MSYIIRKKRVKGLPWETLTNTAENLHRSELTALERAEQIAEWVKLAKDKNTKEREAASEVFSQVGKKPQKGVGSGVRGGAPEGGIGWNFGSS